ncbi:MAG: VOC family protein [Actinobacteria bacterium]|nr:VOC family protein [Actinomycetota bacterium]
MTLSFKRIVYIGLSVRDARQSGDWWRELLGMEIAKENFNAESWPSTWNEVQLIHPESGFQMGFIEHPQNAGEEFSEFRTGLDHIEFEVSSGKSQSYSGNGSMAWESPIPGSKTNTSSWSEIRTISSSSSSCLDLRTKLIDTQRHKGANEPPRNAMMLL